MLDDDGVGVVVVGVGGRTTLSFFLPLLHSSFQLLGLSSTLSWTNNRTGSLSWRTSHPLRRASHGASHPHRRGGLRCLRSLAFPWSHFSFLACLARNPKSLCHCNCGSASLCWVTEFSVSDTLLSWVQDIILSFLMIFTVDPKVLGQIKIIRRTKIHRLWI